ncbi:MAG: hypothetical protein WC483_00500 [Candidatus Paceibacterota bacterium]
MIRKICSTIARVRDGGLRRERETTAAILPSKGEGDDDRLPSFDERQHSFFRSETRRGEARPSKGMGRRDDAVSVERNGPP